MEHEVLEISGVFSAILVGFLLGLRHSIDGDHIVAISTLSRDFNKYIKNLWIGISWGLGHSTPLILIGISVLLFKDIFYDIYEPISLYFEILVSVMWIVLGIQVFWKLYKGNLHIHIHDHDGVSHTHLHSNHMHDQKSNEHKTDHGHNFFSDYMPFFRQKSYLIGFVHGLAGSAAVLLAILPTSPTFTSGILYLFFFCIGTIISMSFMTLLFSAPFRVKSDSRIFENSLISLAGTLSVILGLMLGSDLIFGSEFTSFLWY